MGKEGPLIHITCAMADILMATPMFRKVCATDLHMTSPPPPPPSCSCYFMGLHTPKRRPSSTRLRVSRVFPALCFVGRVCIWPLGNDAGYCSPGAKNNEWPLWHIYSYDGHADTRAGIEEPIMSTQSLRAKESKLVGVSGWRKTKIGLKMKTSHFFLPQASIVLGRVLVLKENSG